jgi:hypothetical protein
VWSQKPVVPIASGGGPIDSIVSTLLAPMYNENKAD